MFVSALSLCLVVSVVVGIVVVVSSGVVLVKGFSWQCCS